MFNVYNFLILYIQCTQYFKEYTQFCLFNLHIFYNEYAKFFIFNVQFKKKNLYLRYTVMYILYATIF